MEKDRLFNKLCWKTEQQYVKDENHIFSHHIKMNSMSKDLNLRPETIKLPEENEVRTHFGI